MPMKWVDSLGALVITQSKPRSRVSRLAALYAIGAHESRNASGTIVCVRRPGTGGSAATLPGVASGPRPTSRRSHGSAMRSVVLTVSRSSSPASGPKAPVVTTETS